MTMMSKPSRESFPPKRQRTGEGRIKGNPTPLKAKIEASYGKEAADKFKASDNWFQRFKTRHKISFRQRSNKKKNYADDTRETNQLFHQNLRKAVKSKRRRNGSATDAKYGRWLPRNRYNIDQVPLPFVIDQNKTCGFTGNKQVWVSQPSTGLDKRQATLQLCIRAEGEQNVKPALVFRGKGNVLFRLQRVLNMTRVSMLTFRSVRGWAAR